MPTEEFFTLASFGQLATAVVVVTVVAGAARRLLRWEGPWVPFLTALAVTYVAAGASGAFEGAVAAGFPTAGFFKTLATWVLPALNACLLFTAAVGATEIGERVVQPPPPPTVRPNAGPRRDEPPPPFFKSWLRP